MKIGDMSICAHCGALLMLAEEGLRLASQQEYEAMDPAARILVSAWPFAPKV
jgi:hypothetical protein